MHYRNPAAKLVYKIFDHIDNYLAIPFPTIIKAIYSDIGISLPICNSKANQDAFQQLSHF